MPRSSNSSCALSIINLRQHRSRTVATTLRDRPRCWGYLHTGADGVLGATFSRSRSTTNSLREWSGLNVTARHPGSRSFTRVTSLLAI